MLDVVLKLVLAVVLGGIIGLEREFSQKPAGLRTNILICTGSTMMMALSGIMLGESAPGAADSLRIAAGVITGMGFIGAGTILQAHGHVHGLTTASTLWVVSGLGLIIGAGYYLIAAVYTGIVVLTLLGFPLLERLIPHKSVLHYHVRVDSIAAVDALRREASAVRLKVDDLAYKNEGDSDFLSFDLVTTLRRARAFRERIENVGKIVELRVD
ncbi:MAG: MgtC/SapB family protein [Candidatus Aminicenantales bacterium]